MFSKIHCLPCGVFWWFFALSYLYCLCYLSSIVYAISALCLLVHFDVFNWLSKLELNVLHCCFFPDFIAYLVVSFGGCPCWVTSPNLCFLWLSVLCTWILLPALRCFWSLYVILPICVFSLQVTLSPLCFLAYLVFSGIRPCSLGFCYLPCVLWWLSVLSEFCLASSNAPSQSLESILLRHVSHRSSNFKRKFVIQFNDI